ncbi:MAG: isoprenylcysteine carboxylmethyltransferase family protein [Sphingomonadales bacterium]
MTTDPRPSSAVSHGVGMSGLVGLTVWMLVARHFQMFGPYAAIAAAVAAGIPMVAWSLLVDKVHRNRTTGIDWSATAKPLSETIDISLAKLAGLWATWAIIAVVYWVGRYYWVGNYTFAMRTFIVASPFLFVASIPYILWLDTRLSNPKDGCWAFGSLLMGDRMADRSAIADHLRSWAVKGFFTAFMLSGFPGNFFDTVQRQWPALNDPVALANFLISVMFLIDMTLATVGYILTMKPLDAHIRSAMPYASGWTAALICYPPFVLMGNGGPLDYHPGTMEWSYWLRNYPALLWINGTALVVLTGIYAWATIAFGIRFSNLTHRGILTHGPYSWMRHPAYVSKNLFWWLSTIPFLVNTNSVKDAIRNTVIMAAVSGVYYWRAMTEEQHLRSDEDYRAYAAWIDRNGWLAKVCRQIKAR